MPELPEVQTVVTTLQPLVGRRLGPTRVLRDDVIVNALRLGSFVRGRTILMIRRRAKRIIFDLSDDRQMQFHLGMTGGLTVKVRDQPLLPHTHLRIAIEGTAEELRFRDPRRFGGVLLLRGGEPAEPRQRQPGSGEQTRRQRHIGPLGPDALEIALPEFRRLLQRGRQIKALLLDQRMLGGLGNIYVDESLFKAGIHPLTSASELAPAAVARLYRAMRRTLLAAIRAGGSTISDYRAPNGEAGWFQLRHQIYGREGAPCRRCRTPIRRIQAAGRSSHICPTCQVRPAGKHTPR